MLDDFRLLLVDDEQEFADTLAERLRGRGAEVRLALSGEIAIRSASQRSFDAIILDVAMPGIDGIETLRRLKAINPNLQVIMLTGKGTVPNAVEAMKLGAVDFVQKPVALAPLLTKIEQAAARKKNLEERQTRAQLEDILRKKGW